MRVVLIAAVRLLVAVALVFLFIPLSSHSDESLWKPLGGGVEGVRVNDMIQFNGDLVIGGQFTRAGGVEVHNAARWDGTQWHAMGSGTWNTISQFARTSSTLYATGGDFYGQTLVAMWDGTDWFPVPGWQQGPVDAIIVWNDKLVLGGTFSYPGSEWYVGVAIWDGAIWSYPDTQQVRMSSAWQLATLGDYLIAGPSTYFPPFTPSGYHPWAAFDGTIWIPMDHGVVPGTYPSEIGRYNGKLMALNNSYSQAFPFQAYEWQDTMWIPTVEPAFISPDSNALPQHSLKGESYGSYYFSWYTLPNMTRVPEVWDGTRWIQDIPGAYCYFEYDGKLLAGLTATPTDHNVLGYRTTLDADADGIYDLTDNCPTTANTDQSDIDKDGIGDNCDPCYACERSMFLDHVEGALSPDTLLVATPITFYLGMSSYDSGKVEILCAPFQLSSPDGASWQTPVFDTLNIGWMTSTFGAKPCHFSFGNQVPDGQSPDTVGMVASARSPLGFVPGFRGVTWKITTVFSPSMSGKTICLDTAAISADVWIPGCGGIHSPLGGPIMFGGPEEWTKPRWMGPYTFTIWNCSRGMTGNIDCDDADRVDISDLATMIDYLYISQRKLCCPLEANTDGVVGIDISDLTRMIDYLYLSFRPLASTPQ